MSDHVISVGDDVVIASISKDEFNIFRCKLYEAVKCHSESESEVVVLPVNSDDHYRPVDCVDDATVVVDFDIQWRGGWDERVYFKKDEFWIDTAEAMIEAIKTISNNKVKFGIEISKQKQL